MTNSKPSFIKETDPRNSRTPCVVIVGGGFGGLAAAKAPCKAATRNILSAFRVGWAWECAALLFLGADPDMKYLFHE
jgi:hypothetical protein